MKPVIAFIFYEVFVGGGGGGEGGRRGGGVGIGLGWGLGFKEKHAKQIGYTDTSSF